MDGYLTRKLVTTPLVLLGVSFILFMLIYVRGPQQAVSCYGVRVHCPVPSKEGIEHFGLNDPWYERYGAWLWEALRGNLGESFYPPWDALWGNPGESFSPPYEMGRSYLLPPVAIMALWGLCTLIVLARGIRKPRLRIDARTGEYASAHRLSLLAISAP